MSLLAYISKTGFSPAIQQQLTDWYRHFQGVVFWEFIRRNIDRECARGDIDTRIWDPFLTDVAGHYATTFPSSPLDPIKSAIDNRKPAPYFLPGHGFATPVETLYRYMPLDQFFKYSYKGKVIAGPMSNSKTLIDKGFITGKDMEGSVFGKRVSGRDYAVWCTDESLARITDGEKARDRLGLKHIAGGYLLELAYPVQLLRDHGKKLTPPTVIDAYAESPDNWIWIKNQNPGPPDWGYAVDMSGGGAGAAGVPEAVHAPIDIGAGEGPSIKLRALDPFARTPPQMDHAAMLQNANM